MGSRSTGLTRLKRINPNIELSDRQMGVECGTGGCAVRLRDPENLAYHRKSHRGENCNIFDCPECSSPEIRESGNSSEHSSFGSWQRLALHLWRVHRLDMELYSCPDCSSFRSFTKYVGAFHLHKFVRNTISMTSILLKAFQRFPTWGTCTPRKR